MKKLIIGIGFTALLAATSLHAELTPELLRQSEQGLEALEQWVTTSGKTLTNQSTLENLAHLATYPKGQELIARYPKVAAQLQTHTTEKALVACAQTIAKLPPAAQKSCMARFKGSVASFITKHKTGINRTVMLALLAGSIYWVCRTHPEILDYAKVMLDQVKDHMHSALSFMTQTGPSYASSAWTATKNFCAEVWNPQASVDAAQATASTTRSAFVQASQNLRDAQMNQNVTKFDSDIANAAYNAFDCSPHLSWWQRIPGYQWLSPATFRGTCAAARQPLADAAQFAQDKYTMQQAIFDDVSDAHTAAYQTYATALNNLDAADLRCTVIKLGRNIAGGVAATGLGLWGALKAKTACLKSKIADTQPTK